MGLKQLLFVFGKNTLLSLCELSHFLQFPPYKGIITDYSKQVGVIEFEEAINHESLVKLQYKLGGTQKICEILMKYPKDVFIDGFPLQKSLKMFKRAREFIENEIELKILPQIFLNIQYNKIFFAVSVYPYLFSNPEISIVHLIQSVNKLTKNLLKKGSNKVKYFRYPEKFLKSPDLNPIWPHNVLAYSLLEFPNAEIVFGFTKMHGYVAKTVAVDNPNLRKFIDECRPKSQFEISIPPKLAKVLINLLNLPQDATLLDPFCGTGTILMVAALQNINFYGTDIDREKIEAAKKNLEWLKEEFNFRMIDLTKKVFILDAKKLASHFKDNSIDGIATEPYLGPPFKSFLTKSEYEKIIEDEIKPLYVEALQNMKEILKINGKIAIISPAYKAKNQIIIDFNLSKIAEDIGLKVIKLLPSSRFKEENEKYFDSNSLLIKKDQIVMRKINLFQKID